jgi:VanZ family protein
MAVIFMASTDAFSAAHTSRFIEPFLLRLFPHLSAQALDFVHLCIRKTAHLVEYGTLGVLLWRAIPEYRTNPEVVDWRRAGVALLVATCYGATDEYHQSFVPSRGSSVHDVVIDACGAAVALTVVALANRLPRRPAEAVVSAAS